MKKVLVITVLLAIIITLYAIGFSTNRYPKFFLTVLLYSLFPSIITIGFGQKILDKVKKKGYKGYLLRKLILLFSLVVFALSIYFTIPYYKDIPNVIFSNYSNLKGRVTIVKFSGRSNSDMNFDIEGVGFSCYRWDFKDLYPGDFCDVIYLENSKYVMFIHKYSK